MFSKQTYPKKFIKKRKIMTLEKKKKKKRKPHRTRKARVMMLVY